MIQGSSSNYHNADIIIFNTGHWWTHQKTFEGYTAHSMIIMLYYILIGLLLPFAANITSRKAVMSMID